MTLNNWFWVTVDNVFSPGSTSLLNGSFGFRGQGYLKVTRGSVGTSGLGFIGLRFLDHTCSTPKVSSFVRAREKRDKRLGWIAIVIGVYVAPSLSSSVRAHQK